MRHLTILAVAVLAALGLPACQDETGGPRKDCLCTTVFIGVDVTVIDAKGDAVPDMRLEVTMTRTGEVLDSSRLFNNPDLGQYGIFNDSFKALVAPAYRFTGEELRVKGYRSELAFEETFRVGVTDECWCHVRKISGPDTVRVD
jgi:hypothetical protein